MALGLLIRPEAPSNAKAITAVTIAAVETLLIGWHTEQFTISGPGGAPAVSLVAVLDGRLVGCVALSPVSVSDGTPDCFSLGPMSLLPSHQLHGVGEVLIREDQAHAVHAQSMAHHVQFASLPTSASRRKLAAAYNPSSRLGTAAKVFADVGIEPSLSSLPGTGRWSATQT